MSTDTTGSQLNGNQPELSAEPPRSVTRSSFDERPKPAVHLAFLWILQEESRLSPGQLRFLRSLQGRLRVQELERAIELHKKLKSSPRALARSKLIRANVLRCTPSWDESTFRAREARRIGVGYRDKGSLRQSHRPRPLGSRAWWSEDIAPALLLRPEEPRWISTEELFGLERHSDMQELAFHAFIQNSSASQAFLSRSGWEFLLDQGEEG